MTERKRDETSVTKRVCGSDKDSPSKEGNLPRKGSTGVAREEGDEVQKLVFSGGKSPAGTRETFYGQGLGAYGETVRHIRSEIVLEDLLLCDTKEFLTKTDLTVSQISYRLHTN